MTLWARSFRLFGLFTGAVMLAGCGSVSGSGSAPQSTAARPTVAAAGATASTTTAAGVGALNLSSKWHWDAPPPASVGMPAADDKGIAVVSGRHLLTLLDPAGTAKWQADRTSLRDVAPTLTPDLVLVATEDGVAAWDRASGRSKWDTKLGQRANTPVVVGSRAVVSTWEGSLTALDLATGVVAWTVDLGGPAMGPAAAAPGPVAVATFDTGRSAGAVAFDASTGRQKWSVPLKADGVSAPAVSTGGTVVVVAADVAAHGLSLDDGSERWRRPLDGSGSPEVPPEALPDGTVLVGHRQGGMALLDAKDGSVRWQVGSDGAAVRGSPAGPGPNGWYALPLDDGRVLVAGPDRKPQLRAADSTAATGVAAGPGGMLVVTTGQGQQNGVRAIEGW